MPYVSNTLLPFTAVALTITPIGNPALGLVLLLVADLAIALVIARMIAARRKKAESTGSVVVINSDMPTHLLRRVEPALRSRRPMGVVEMQVRWRQAAEAHRRTREKA